MKVVDFDPEKHKGRKLYELQTIDRATVPVPAEVDYQTAAKTPFYYVVLEDNG